MTPKNLTIITLSKSDIKDFAYERNRLLQQAKTDWVLFLDQDETLTTQLKQEIERVIKNKQSQFYAAYKLRRVDYFMGKKLKFGETGNVSFVRLAKKDWGVWKGVVHEQWEGRGLTGILHNPLIHHPHHHIAQFVTKINFYSTLAASERQKQGIKSTFLHIILFPPLKFLNNYILKLGILDGIPGLIHAIIMSWHSYLTHTKNYLLWHQK